MSGSGILGAPRWPVAVAKRIAPAEPDPCPECDGVGYTVGPGCCGEFCRDGSCCGQAVQTQYRCGYCIGTCIDPLTVELPAGSMHEAGKELAI